MPVDVDEAAVGISGWLISVLSAMTDTSVVSALTHTLAMC